MDGKRSRARKVSNNGSLLKYLDVEGDEIKEQTSKKKKNTSRKRAVEDEKEEGVEDEENEEVEKERKRRNALDFTVVANLEHVPKDVLRQKIFSLLSDESLLSVGSVSRRLYQATRGDISNRAHEKTGVKHAQALSRFNYFCGVATRLIEGRGSHMDLISMLHLHRLDFGSCKKYRGLLTKPLMELNFDGRSDESSYARHLDLLIPVVLTELQVVSVDNAFPLSTIWKDVQDSISALKQIRLRLSEYELPWEWLSSDIWKRLLKRAFKGDLKMQTSDFGLNIQKIGVFHQSCIKMKVTRTDSVRLELINELWFHGKSVDLAISSLTNEVAKREVRKPQIFELDPYLLEREPMFPAIKVWLCEEKKQILDVLKLFDVVRRAFEYSSKMFWDLFMGSWRHFIVEFTDAYLSDLLKKLIIAQPRDYFSINDGLFCATISYLQRRCGAVTFLEFHSRALEALKQLGTALFKGLKTKVDEFVVGTISRTEFKLVWEKRVAFLMRYTWLWEEINGKGREMELKKKLEVFELNCEIEPRTFSETRKKVFGWFPGNACLNRVHESFLYGELSKEKWKESMCRWTRVLSDFGADANFAVKVLPNYLFEEFDNSAELEYEKLLKMKQREEYLVDLGRMKACTFETLYNSFLRGKREVQLFRGNNVVYEIIAAFVRGESRKDCIEKLGHRIKLIVKAQYRFKKLWNEKYDDDDGEELCGGRVDDLYWDDLRSKDYFGLQELPQNVANFFRVNDQLLQEVLSEDQWREALNRIAKLNCLKSTIYWPSVVCEFCRNYVDGKMEESKWLVVLDRIARYPVAPSGLKDLHDAFLRFDFSEQEWYQAIKRSSRYPREEVPLELLDLFDEFLLGKSELSEKKWIEIFDRDNNYPKWKVSPELRELRNSYVMGKPEVTEQMLIDALERDSKYPKYKFCVEIQDIRLSYVLGKPEVTEQMLDDVLYRDSKYPKWKCSPEVRLIRNGYVLGKPEVTEQMLIDALEEASKK